MVPVQILVLFSHLREGLGIRWFILSIPELMNLGSYVCPFIPVLSFHFLELLLFFRLCDATKSLCDGCV